LGVVNLEAIGIAVRNFMSEINTIEKLYLNNFLIRKNNFFHKLKTEIFPKVCFSLQFSEVNLS
jgi:hypothetical protein